MPTFLQPVSVAGFVPKIPEQAATLWRAYCANARRALRREKRLAKQQRCDRSLSVAARNHARINEQTLRQKLHDLAMTQQAGLRVFQQGSI